METATGGCPRATALPAACHAARQAIEDIQAVQLGTTKLIVPELGHVLEQLSR